MLSKKEFLGKYVFLTKPIVFNILGLAFWILGFTLLIAFDSNILGYVSGIIALLFTVLMFMADSTENTEV